MNTSRPILHFLSTALLLAFVSSANADTTTSKPVMMMPASYDHGKCLKDLFQHPDQWTQTRSKITTLSYADWLLNRDFTDDELKQWLPLVQQWGLKLGLEVGAIRDKDPTGEGAFKEHQRYWDRLTACGAHIDIIAMDEPFHRSRFHDHITDLSDDATADQTANYIKLVHDHNPGMKVCEIEPYPSLSLQDIETWIDLLQAKLKEKGTSGIDMFRVDVDWQNFVVGNSGSWKEVKQLENFCHSRKIPFSLVYWAANHPLMVAKGYGDDSTWYTSTMQMGYDYVAVGGKPDEYVIESWVEGPSQTVPETAPWSFTRSVLDFCNKFVK